MRKIILFFCLMLGIQAYSQGYSSSSVNLFTRGEKIDKAVRNFENLKANVEKYSDAKVKILKYEKWGVVKDSLQAVELIRYNFLHAPAYKRGIVYDSINLKQSERKMIKIDLQACKDSVSREDYLRSSEGDRFIKLSYEGILMKKLPMNFPVKGVSLKFGVIKPGDSIWKLYYSINGKKYMEYDFIDSQTNLLCPRCSFWGFTSSIVAIENIPLGNWVKSKAIGWKHSANDFFRKIPETVEHRTQTKDIGLEQWKSGNTPMNVLAPDEAIQENCRYATYTVFSPSNGDDIHVAVDVVWKQVGDEVKIVSYQVRLKGSLEKRAIFSKIFERDIMYFGYYKKKKLFEGSIMGNLYYFTGDKENKVIVKRQFELSAE